MQSAASRPEALSTEVTGVSHTALIAHESSLWLVSPHPLGARACVEVSELCTSVRKHRGGAG